MTFLLTLALVALAILAHDRLLTRFHERRN
jgi:hypothetical protein